MNLETRTLNTLRVVSASKKAMSAREIAEQYLENPTASDALTTGTICNILSVTGVLKRTEYFKKGTKSKRVKYEFIK